MHRYSSPADAEDDDLSVDHPSTSSLTLTLHFSSDENSWITPPRPNSTAMPTAPTTLYVVSDEEEKDADEDETESQRMHAWF